LFVLGLMGNRDHSYIGSTTELTDMCAYVKIIARAILMVLHIHILAIL